MEKATLILTVSKKKKVVATLRFEDGKEIPVHQLKFPDTALDGVEVEVERQAGKIVLVKTDDKVLYDAQAQQKTSAPEKPRRQPQRTSRSGARQAPVAKPSSTQTQVSARKDGHDEHIKYVRNPAYAPYNFVPLNREVVEINPTPPPFEKNKYYTKRNTGWIELEIEAKTPLYIRGTLTEDEVREGKESKDKPEFCAPAKRIRIPGSSLRGMVRNMVEMVSFGRFHFFEDRRLYYRGLADRSNLREEYQGRMSSYDRRARRTQYHFSVGVLRKSEKKEKGVHYEIKSSGDNFRQVYKDEAREMVRALGETYAQFNYYKVKRGYLVVSGDMPNKKRDWLIARPTDDAEIISISEEDVRSYHDDRTRDDRVPNLLELARRNDEGVPCFYVLWQDANGKDRVSFGHTGMFRLAYEHSIGEHITTVSHRINDQVLEELKNDLSESSFKTVRQLNGNEFTQSELVSTLEKKNFKWNEIKKILQAGGKIDFSGAVFGNEHSFAGRVFFEDAFLSDPQSDPQLQSKTPQILSTPKPTTFQHYLVQDSDEVKQLNHYNSDAAIRGHKLYWHKSGERWIESERKAKDTQYIEIKPVKAGTIFQGRIRFENLSEKELGALLFALDLPENCGHKLGMGKPLGLGSIHVTPRLYLSDRSRRYQNIFAEWNDDIDAAGYETQKNLKDKFEQYVLDKLKVTNLESKLLWETDRMRELLLMLRYDVGQELEEKGVTRYMKIAPQNEFKNRYVLPKPTSMLSPAERDEIIANVKEQTTVQKPKPRFIKKIEIKGLWEKYDITWPPDDEPLDDEVSILVGINGSGKTTILELIRYAFEDEYKDGVYFEPEEFILTFDNSDRIRYQRKERVESPSYWLSMEYISTFDVSPKGEERKRDEKVSSFFKRQLTEELWQRISRLRTERDSLPENIDSALYYEEFIDIVNDAFERPKKTAEFVGAFTIDRETVSRISERENIPEDICTRLQGMISNNPYFPGSEFLDDLEGRLGKDEAARYRSLILKHVSFDHSSDPSHIVFRLDDGRIIMPDQLSAGEKQMINILLAALILQLKSLASAQKYSVLIMDEPELSLHMSWQKTLIDNIKRLSENSQIIIATHSPDIIEKGWMDKAIGVDEIKQSMD